MSRRTEAATVTNRQALAQIVVCFGCCCGQDQKGHPTVPVEWLKAEWKRRLLQKKVHLSISGCLGPCDKSNVVAVMTPSGSTWLGGIEHQNQYRDLLDWASLCDRAGAIQPLPHSLKGIEFERFREGTGVQTAVA